mgnify:CR=1 FL=1
MSHRSTDRSQGQGHESDHSAINRAGHRESDRDAITGLSDRHEARSDSGTDDGADESGFDQYRFSYNKGKVTNLQELDGGRWRTERIDGSESWTFDGTNLIKTETGSHGTSISSFGDLDGDGIFTRNTIASSPFSSGLGNNTTALG